MRSTIAMSSTKRRFKKETAVHLCIIAVALLGCIVNIAHLAHRKKVVQDEIVQKFKIGYVKRMGVVLGHLNQLTRSVTVSMRYQDLRIDDIMYPGVYETKNNETSKQKRKSFLSLLRSVVDKKIDNPFLFGFTDLSEPISREMEVLLAKDRNTSGEKKYIGLVKENIEAYFGGDLEPKWYKAICDIFLSILREFEQSIATSAEVVSGTEYIFYFTVRKEEYEAAACYIGEISSSIIGQKRIHAEEFARLFKLQEQEIKATKVSCLMEKMLNENLNDSEESI